MSSTENEPAARETVRLRERVPVRPGQSLIMGRFFAVAFAFLLLAVPMQATEELLPPFGFRWNDSMQRVETVLKGAKARVVLREKKEGRDIWTVEGLVHPGLKRTRFTFTDRGLYGVELLYEYDRPIEWY
ncbi:MAG: hypothetical protein ACREIW_10380, partial [Chthoniobacterales bacterium]